MASLHNKYDFEEFISLSVFVTGVITSGISWQLLVSFKVILAADFVDTYIWNTNLLGRAIRRRMILVLEGEEVEAGFTDEVLELTKFTGGGRS